MSALKLNFDNGIREFEVTGGAVLRFNPRDPNVSARFMEATKKLEQIESEFVAKAEALKVSAEENPNNGAQVLELMQDADRKIKDTLDWIFGESNDFDAIFGGQNVLAVCENGERLVTNFVAALIPIIQEGAQAIVSQQVNTAVGAAKQNRAQRRAKK